MLSFSVQAGYTAWVDSWQGIFTSVWTGLPWADGRPPDARTWIAEDRQYLGAVDRLEERTLCFAMNFTRFHDTPFEPDVILMMRAGVEPCIVLLIPLSRICRF